LRALFYSFVRLPEGKMSTRRGNVVYLDEILQEGLRKAEEIIKDRGYDEEEVKNIARSVASPLLDLPYSTFRKRNQSPLPGNVPSTLRGRAVLL